MCGILVGVKKADGNGYDAFFFKIFIFHEGRTEASGAHEDYPLDLVFTENFVQFFDKRRDLVAAAFVAVDAENGEVFADLRRGDLTDLDLVRLARALGNLGGLFEQDGGGREGVRPAANNPPIVIDGIYPCI